MSAGKNKLTRAEVRSAMSVLARLRRGPKNMTPAALAANRRNGKNGGRPRGRRVKSEG